MSESSYFTRAFIKPVIQTWLASLDCTKDSTKHNRMYIQYENGKVDENGNSLARFGYIQFYDKSVAQKEAGEFYGDIMEISVYEDVPLTMNCQETFSQYIAKTNKEPNFYLHFEMHDFEFVMEQLSAFFRYLYEVDKCKHFEETVEKCSKEIKHIMICCTAGLTSSYFAAMMQQKVDSDCPDQEITIDACNINFLSDYIDNIDIVLITPQIYYMEKELKEKYGDKIQKIDRVDFATFNFESVLKNILKR